MIILISYMINNTDPKIILTMELSNSKEIRRAWIRNKVKAEVKVDNLAKGNTSSKSNMNKQRG